ncbi:coiled-coil domain-containing protein 153-like [Astyanax mexicanus]|uniref:Dynein regulatory complex protein 12 n=1 Tax=Astyanax mexicanus TaxID=7994 RepID=A0A8T2L2P9_ASTMX|nr:coiled-coil domain-containing protein 153-like [Astyanax mexicanus]
MPPKKRKGKAKKPKSSKTERVAGDEVAQSYRRSLLEVAVLKDHLALKTDVAQQAISARDDLQYQIRDLKQTLSQEKLGMKDITTDLNRQYKTLQTNLEAKVEYLETRVSELQQQLDQCQGDLKTEREQREQTEEEKDAQITDLQSKLDNMETEYEKILHFDTPGLLSHLAEARRNWEDVSSDIHQEFKDMLIELRLNPHYI